MASTNQYFLATVLTIEFNRLLSFLFIFAGLSGFKLYIYLSFLFHSLIYWQSQDHDRSNEVSPSVLGNATVITQEHQREYRVIIYLCTSFKLNATAFCQIHLKRHRNQDLWCQSYREEWCPSDVISWPLFSLQHAWKLYTDPIAWIAHQVEIAVFSSFTYKLYIHIYHGNGL